MDFTDSEREQIEQEIHYVQSNIIYLKDCCEKYGIKGYADYKALKKFVRIFDDLISKEIIEFKE